jgi:hypothetical protein
MWQRPAAASGHSQEWLCHPPLGRSPDTASYRPSACEMTDVKKVVARDEQAAMGWGRADSGRRTPDWFSRPLAGPPTLPHIDIGRGDDEDERFCGGAERFDRNAS